MKKSFLIALSIGCIGLLAASIPTQARDRDTGPPAYSSIKKDVKNTPTISTFQINNTIAEMPCIDVGIACIASVNLFSTNLPSQTMDGFGHADIDLINLDYNLRRPERTFASEYSDGIYNLSDRQSSDNKPPAETTNQFNDAPIVVPLK